MTRIIGSLLLLAASSPASSSAFQLTPTLRPLPSSSLSSSSSSSSSPLPIISIDRQDGARLPICLHNTSGTNEHDNVVSQRRQFLQKAAAATAAVTALAIDGSSSTALAAEVEESVATATATATSIVQNTIEMKTFVDPKGLFAINVPKRFFAIRRTVKGDLPNEKTGQGRRGSSIFTAGDMSKAEVVAVERFPTRVLLEEEGITPSGDLSTFSSIGNPTAIANLIALRRDKDKQTQARTIVIPNSVYLSSDDKTLYFSLSQSIDVQKPELLMEQTGLSELVRVTLAKATLSSNDGQMMAVFASALQQDYMDVDGPALRESVDSFVALDQSNRN